MPTSIDSVRESVGMPPEGMPASEKRRHPTRQGMTIDELRKSQPTLLAAKAQRPERREPRSIDDVRGSVGMFKPPLIKPSDMPPDDEPLARADAPAAPPPPSKKPEAPPPPPPSKGKGKKK